MRFREMALHVWTAHRGLLIFLVVLLVGNIALLTVSERVLAPRVAEQESRFMKKQTEVRNLLRTKGSSARSPEHLYLLGKQDLSAFFQKVPQYDEFTALIEELIVLADRSDLEIEEINYSFDKADANNLLGLKLNFDVSGDYGQVKEFVHFIEQSVRLIVIEQISLQGQAGDEVNLRLALETYFLVGDVGDES
jgi:Tfp pilus assembly protein PilO